MPSRSSGTDSSLRTTKAETRSARCGVDSEAAGGKSLSGDLAAFEGAAGSTGLVAASSSVGTHADAGTKCAAVDCPGEWSTARHLPVEPRRTKQDRSIAVGAPHRLSAGGAA